MLFSEFSITSVEEKMKDFYKTAIAYKQDTALGIIRPVLRFLDIMSGKLERPPGFAFPEDLARAKDGLDVFAVWIVHFLQVVLAYIFGDLETATKEARELEEMMRMHLHPGYSGVLTFYCLTLLATARHRHGLVRRRLLSAAKRSMKKLEQFSLYVPENCLHKLNLVEAELAVVSGNYDQALRKYVEAISAAKELGVLWTSAIGCERFACFLRDRGDETGAVQRFREAQSAFENWGAVSKVEQLEKEAPELFRSSLVATEPAVVPTGSI